MAADVAWRRLLHVRGRRFAAQRVQRPDRGDHDQLRQAQSQPDTGGLLRCDRQAARPRVASPDARRARGLLERRLSCRRGHLNTVPASEARSARNGLRMPHFHCHVYPQFLDDDPLRLLDPQHGAVRLDPADWDERVRLVRREFMAARP